MSEKISVIVPVYQVEKYVVNCIESICNQTYTNLEIILVDDGSKDKSGQICDSYSKKDSRIQVIHKINGGLSDARNYGIDRATGEYICFIDSDDMIAQNYIEKLFNLLKKENADIAICDYQEVYSKDEIKVGKEAKKICNFSSYEAIKELYNDNDNVKMVVTWNKLYKTALFSQIRFPVGKLHEDEFTTYKLFYNAKKIVVTNEKLYYYVKRDGSIMRQKYYLKRLDILNAYEERMNFFKEHHEEELYKLTFQHYCYTINVHYACCKIYLPQERKVQKQLIKKMRKNWLEFIQMPIIPIKSKISYSVTCLIPRLIIIRMKNNLENYYGKKNGEKMLKKIKEIIKKFLKISSFNIYKLKCKVLKRKQYILFSTPLHGNLGDHAIVIAENKILKDNQIIPFEVSTWEENICYNYILKHINKDTVICITGGGFIGSQWLNEENFVRQIIHDYSEHTIIIFPQTFYYKDDEDGRREYKKSKEIYEKAKNLKVFVREEKSYGIAQKMLPNANIQLVPDIVLYLKQYNYKEKSDKVLLCIRDDVESKLKEKEMKEIEKIAQKYGNIEYTDTVLKKFVKARNRRRAVKKKLQEFADSKVVITDRLHGMIFAYLTKTPCVALGNYNYKVKGVYEWIKECPYIKFVNSIDELEENIKKIINIKDIEFNNNLKNEFDILNKVLKGE